MAGLSPSKPTVAVSDEEKADVESQSKTPDVDAAQPKEATPDTNTSSGVDFDADHNHDSSGLSDNTNVPRLSYARLFWFFFYNFGLFAWGGPVAQIALIKDRLVVQDKWITLARFQRVFSVYQILPGPEAAELCMFFGCLSAGRIGGIIAGIAFALPGFVLMLLASYLYSLAGFENKYFNASFRALQPIVAAMVWIFPPSCWNRINKFVLQTGTYIPFLTWPLDSPSYSQNRRSFGTEARRQKNRPFSRHRGHLHSS